MVADMGHDLPPAAVAAPDRDDPRPHLDGRGDDGDDCDDCDAGREWPAWPDRGGAVAGPLAGVRVIELAGHRPRPVRGDDALRHGRRGHPRRAGPGRPRPGAATPHCGRAAAGPAQHRPRPQAPRRRRPPCSTLVERADALHRGLPAGRHGALGVGPDVCLARNPKLVFGRMTGLGAGRARTRPRPGTTSTTSRSPARSRTSAARASRRRRRSTWSATSAAAGCSSPSASCARCSRRSAAVRARSSTRRWSTARP